MSIKITKAQIKGSLFLAYEYTQTTEEGVKNKIKTSSDAVIHPDLQNAFKKLIPHFALITEEVKEREVKGILKNELELPENLEEKFRVSGFSLSGSADSEGVTIIGGKTLENHKVVNFNTPFVQFEEDDGYPYQAELNRDIENCIAEVHEYLEGKQAVNPQTSMDFGDEFEPVQMEVQYADDQDEVQEVEFEDIEESN